MHKSRQLSLKECYSILILEKGATLEDVKRAYRRRAFELHPDLHPGNVEAGRQFQRLNEAYVALSQILQTEAAKEEGARAEREESRRDTSADRGQTASASGPTGTASDATQEQAASAQEAGPTAADGDKSDTATSTEESSESEERRKRAASAAYGREEVLRDLLNDPFARRVFEDIYSEVNRQTQTDSPPQPPQPKPEPAPQPKAPPKPRKVQMEWGTHKLNLDFSKGLKGMVKGWLRHQIDDEQTIKMPASSLVPGARIRLQIRRGLSEEPSTIEITLPRDFVVGKPVRLRGLGRKVGNWQGDLYLTLESK